LNRERTILYKERQTQTYLRASSRDQILFHLKKNLGIIIFLPNIMIIMTPTNKLLKIKKAKQHQQNANTKLLLQTQNDAHE